MMKPTDFESSKVMSRAEQDSQGYPCPECVEKDKEISRLRAKYEMSAEDQLKRLKEQNRAAQKRYREKRK